MKKNYYSGGALLRVALSNGIEKPQLE